MRKYSYSVLVIELFVALLLVLLPSERAYSTNLRWGRILQPRDYSYLSPKPQILAAYCRNDSIYTAYNFKVYITVQDAFSFTKVFSDTISVASLKARDSAIVGSAKWYPSYAGRFRVTFLINYIDDVIPSDNYSSFNFSILPPFVGLFTFGQFDLLSPFTQANSTKGFFQAKLPPLSKNAFVNVLIKSPADASAYLWIVQNLPFFVSNDSTSMSTYFDLAKLGVIPGKKVDSLDVQICVSDSGWVEELIAENENRTKVDHPRYDVPANTELDTPATILKNFAIEVGQVWKSPPATTQVVDRRSEMPNIDLDDSKYPRNKSQSWGGDLSACGPAAAANSMQWLLKKHNLTDTTGLRYKLGELSYLMRRDSGGASVQQMIRGKLDYIDKYQLPIHVKFQSMGVNPDVATISSGTSKYEKYKHSASNKIDKTKPGNFPTIDFIMSEMQHGEDVALLVGWYDLSKLTDQRLGGHWFTLAGSGYNGVNPYVIENDDADQRSPGGTTQSLVYLKDPPDNVISGPIIPELERTVNGKTITCIVESVVSESYDSTVTFYDSAVEEFAENSLSCTFSSASTRDLQANVYAPFNTEAYYSITDLRGIIVCRSELMTLHQGENSVPIIEYETLRPGAYFLRMNTKHGSQAFKFIR